MLPARSYETRGGTVQVTDLPRGVNAAFALQRAASDTIRTCDDWRWSRTKCSTKLSHSPMTACAARALSRETRRDGPSNRPSTGSQRALCDPGAPGAGSRRADETLKSARPHVKLPIPMGTPLVL